MTTRSLPILVLAAALSGCSLGHQATPALTGPSEQALSLAITASPDAITQDGFQTSAIRVFARDASGQPVKGLLFRADILVGSIPVDYGTLSNKTPSTDNSGVANVTYTAPAAPPPTVSSDTTVTVRLVPVSSCPSATTSCASDYANETPRFVDIRLIRPGVILPPNGTPVPVFFFSPQQPHENDQIQFDATGSSDDGQIVSYAWNFGDGTSGTGAKVSHTYTVAGAYNVTLTVKDDRGLSASTAPTPVSVTAAIDPTASFVLSPTDPTVGNMVSVNAAGSTVPPGRSIVAYEWDFGDGGKGSGLTTTHFYTQAKTFTVVLTVTDSTGRKNSTSKTITVGP